MLLTVGIHFKYKIRYSISLINIGILVKRKIDIVKNENKTTNSKH